MMSAGFSYSSLPMNRLARLAAILGLKPDEIARLDEHPLQIEYLGDGTAMAYVTKLVAADAAELQRLLAIDAPASPSSDTHVSSSRERGAN